VTEPALEPRIERTRSIDLLRGGVIVLMVLDHARDFFVGVGPGPTLLATTTLPLFLTRWLTHFCAPVFVLLAGVSAQLYAQKRGLPAARHFLLTRGLWLVVLELTIVRFAWIPEPFYHFVLLQVIWVLGWAMVALAGLSYLPTRAVVALGALIVVGHNALDRFDRGNFGQLEPVWNLLHERAMLKLDGSHRVFVSYPFLPWLGVVSLGFGLGAWFRKPAAERQRLLIRCGAAATLGFVLLRALNVYGDPVPWSDQARGSAFTVLSFLNCQKYPPSLAYLLMTLGPALIVLGLLERVPSRSWQPLVTFGRVPLFFYVAHLYLLRFSAAPLAFARFGPSAFQPPPGHAGSPEYPLWTAYVALIVALLLLYPACRWFARKKAESRSPWLSYL
jgi:uncharacterized membrane protein